MDMVRQINSAGATYKGSYLHDAVLQRNPNLPPLSKLDYAEFLSEGKIKFAGTFNELHPEWTRIGPMIEKGFLDGISIEFMPDRFDRVNQDGKNVRVLQKMKFLGYGHLPRPMNVDSAITNVFKKSFDQFEDNEVSNELINDFLAFNESLSGSNSVGPKSEVSIMDETKTVTIPVDAATTATLTVTNVSTPAEVKQETPAQESKPQETEEVKQLKAQLEEARKELEEIKAKSSDAKHLEEIKSFITDRIKELQPQAKVLIPSEGLEVADKIKQIDLSVANIAYLNYGG